MRIYLYSTQSKESKDGGGNSTSTTYKYLLKNNHDIQFFKSVHTLEKAISQNRPELILHHNIKNLNDVFKISKKYNVPIIVTINNLITCMTGVHIKYDCEFGSPCLQCGFFSGILCQLKERNIRPFNEKLWAILTYPARYYARNRRIHILNNVDGVIVIGETLRNLLRRNGVKRDIYVCPQPIDATFLIKPKRLLRSDKKIIFYQGAGEPFKGIRVLLKAFNSLKRDDVELVIAGDIRPANNLDINKLMKKNPSIKFIGLISSEEMKLHYYSADIFVFPSLWLEAYGRGWAEAACCGKPILAFKNRGGASDYLVDGSTALLPNPESVSFTDKLNLLLDNNSLRHRLGNNAKEFARGELIASQVIKKLENIYSEVLKNGD